MMLVEEGKIRLNDPVSRFIPEFKALDKVAVAKPGATPSARSGLRRRSISCPPSRPITIADLLKHGSGLVSGGLGASARRTTRATRADRHARDLHSEARRGAARFSARHAVALQRPGRLRRPQPRRRSRLGTDVRRVSEAAIARSARDEGHRILSRAGQGVAARHDLSDHAAGFAAGQSDGLERVLLRRRRHDEHRGGLSAVRADDAQRRSVERHGDSSVRARCS